MIEREEGICRSLADRFGFLEGKYSIPRERRIFVEVSRENMLEVIEYAAGLGFNSLCTITGLDLGEELQSVYHIADKNGMVINVKVNVPKSDPVIKTVINIYNGSVFYERELEGMLGFKVEGLAQGRHYPLPDNWPEGQYPLRKDWKAEMMHKAKGGTE